ncbi:acylamino-acid-releasing enzyme-like isoform X2 [Leptidea sinapis]|uniref:acylamino-acid-releasing enzyme-like isoform X2 n=1 Tax=Leptidea sinapis TaxID=189913 RepID=UPI002143F849|nr:acylamino-acid-releasing enzyme-like isoform X2 [Leptidea sinapis]
MSAQVENIINVYKTLSKIPTIISGTINNTGTKIASRWSVRNIDKGKNTQYMINYVLNNDLKVIAESDFGVDVSNELMTSISPKETYKAVIREEKNGKDNSKKFFLEIWSKKCLSHSIDLLALEIHGDVYTDAEFGTLEWSSDEKYLIYIAEEKPKKSEPFIKRKPAEKDKDGASGDKKAAPGEEFVYRQDWGEQLTGKKSSVIVQCEVESETLTILQGLPDNKCPGQVRFTPDGKGIVGVVWDAARPRRLGLVFCTNRISQLFYLGFDRTYRRLSKDLCAVRSPRFLHNGDLIWLQRVPDEPHHACMKIVKLTKNKLNEIVSNKPAIGNDGVESVVVDIVDTSTPLINGESFYGVYAHSLPRRCEPSNDGRVVFSTVSVNEVRCYVLEVASGKLVDISRKKRGSTTILCANGDMLLASFSSITTPAQLYVAKLPKAGHEHTVDWKRVNDPDLIPERLAKLKVNHLKLEHKESEDQIKKFTAIVTHPDEADVFPMLVWPHGGPHSAFVDSYSLETAFFCLIGFRALKINFRGSTGQGDKNVRCLIGHIGDYDVKDCLLAIETATSGSMGQCVLYGGSYGGFTVTHLAGRYPKMFKAMVLRNPLVDLATKVNYADNPDGCYAEVGSAFLECGEVQDRDLLAMRQCSPMKFVHEVCAPTAIMLGSGDKRVPYYQGLEYAHRLSSNGTINKVFMYDDNHSLSSLPVEMDNLINAADWFFTHLKA